MSTTVDEVVAVLAARRYRYTCEDDLQVAVYDTLRRNGGRLVRREVVFRGYGTIDVMAGRVGIECKVDGSVPAVIRQLDRYARSGRVDALVLVTSRAQHARIDGQRLHDVPVSVVMARAGL